MRFAGVAIALLLLGAALRFEGMDWDGGHLLHPDERFLVMLARDAELPRDLATYLSPERSPLNPHNLGRDFFVYGTLPTTALVALDSLVGASDHAGLAMLGRRLAAAADSVTILLSGLLGWLLARAGREPDAEPGGGSPAAASGVAAVGALSFYALSVLAIQAAHFFTVDAFLTAFGTLALVLALAAGGPGRLGSLQALLAGAALGLATACKLPALLLAPLVLAWAAWPRAGRFSWASLGPGATQGLLVAAGWYLALRVGDPAFFASASWLDPRPSPHLLGGLERLAEWSRLDGFYPPAIQWIDRAAGLYPLGNLAGVGLGPPAFLAAVAGVGWALRRPLSRRGVAALWVIAAIAFLSLRTVQSLRYFLPLLPVLAALSGLALRDAWLSARPPLRLAGTIGLALLLLAWPLAFRAIYQEPHSRARASDWIRAHVPRGSSIGHEHWDDRLPLPGGVGEVSYAYRELPVFAPDTDLKWTRLEALLDASDFLVLSSNRGYGSIGRVPEKYPRMAQFYEDLFAGRTDFVLEAEFTSFPRLFGIAFDTQWAEEAFHVYDHPKVSVFRNSRGRR